MTHSVNTTVCLKNGATARVLAFQEFEGYVTYTVESDGRTFDVDDSELEAPPTSDRDQWAILLLATIVGGGLFMLLVRTLLTGA